MPRSGRHPRRRCRATSPRRSQGRNRGLVIEHTPGMGGNHTAPRRRRRSGQGSAVGQLLRQVHTGRRVGRHVALSGQLDANACRRLSARDVRRRSSTGRGEHEVVERALRHDRQCRTAWSCSWSAPRPRSRGPRERRSPARRAGRRPIRRRSPRRSSARSSVRRGGPRRPSRRTAPERTNPAHRRRRGRRSTLPRRRRRRTRPSSRSR